MPTVRLTKRTVDEVAPADRDRFIWDSDLKGFGLKVTAKGKKVFVLQYRIGGRAGKTKRYTIGTHGTLTAEEARTEAKRLLGGVRTGQDPAEERATRRRDTMTIADLCDEYLEKAKRGEILRKDGERKRASTLEIDEGRIERHIKPLLGKKKVAALNKKDVETFRNGVAAGKTAANVKTGKHGRAIVKGGSGTATRTLGLLSGILSYAVEAGYRADNPVHGVKREKDKARERFLSEEELARLGEALTAAEQEQSATPHMIAAIRLLIFTGARLGEILALEWRHVDLERGLLSLPTSKTGARTIYLSAPAQETLASLPREKDNPYVICGEKAGTHLVNLQRPWHRIRAKAGLDDLRLHDLRHSFASQAAGGGHGLYIIGKLLGHRHAVTTQRYAHLDADPVRRANDETAARIAKAMAGDKSAKLIPFKR